MRCVEAQALAEDIEAANPEVEEKVCAQEQEYGSRGWGVLVSVYGVASGPYFGWVAARAAGATKGFRVPSRCRGRFYRGQVTE